MLDVKMLDHLSLEFEMLKVVSDFRLKENLTNVISKGFWILCKYPGAEQEYSAI